VRDGTAAREPRFVYLCDGTRDQQPAGRYGWRLNAANHRPLGRGTLATKSLDQCRAAARLLHREAMNLEQAVASQHGEWSWEVSLGDAAVAVSVHGYARRIECMRGLHQFLAAARVADPEAGVVRYFGAHSLRGYRVGRRATGAYL